MVKEYVTSHAPFSGNQCSTKEVAEYRWKFWWVHYLLLGVLEPVRWQRCYRSSSVLLCQWLSSETCRLLPGGHWSSATLDVLTLAHKQKIHLWSNQLLDFYFAKLKGSKTPSEDYCKTALGFKHVAVYASWIIHPSYLLLWQTGSAPLAQEQIQEMFHTTCNQS